MHDPARLLDTLAPHGVDLATGVPCSLQGGLFAALEAGRGPAYVPASGEGEAVGIAAGAWTNGWPLVGTPIWGWPGSAILNIWLRSPEGAGRCTMALVTIF